MNQNLGYLSKLVANTALEVTPIISRPNPPSAIAVGCGIFLRINEDRYLISAGHLMNKKDWPELMVPGNFDNMVYLNGTLITTYEKPSGMSEYDFAVLKFSERQNKYFVNGSFAFCNPHNILVNHKIDPNGHYIISGYPVTGVKKVSGKAEFHPMPVKFLTEAMSDKTYTTHHIDSEYFILVKYQRKVAPFGSSVKQITKEIQGISGSGLWYVPNWNECNNGVPNFYLVGIMVENHKEKRFLKALRIDFVTQVIKDNFIYSAFEQTNFKIHETKGTFYKGHIP